MKEPIFLSPVFKDYIWGGKQLNEIFHKNSPYEITAESWEISTNPDGTSKIKNGTLENKSLEEVFQNAETRVEIFGSKTKQMDKFPLLIKFIDASSNLSVQVHPDDAYAFQKENGQQGKTEMWYIMECKPGAKIICGMKEGCKQEEVASIIKNGKIEENLNYVDVQKGDCIYIPAGTIHAILGDTLICEVQQNSNLTYRVYDWGRVGKDGKPRQLHVEKAIDVIKVDSRPVVNHTANQKETERNIMSSPFFETSKVVIEHQWEDKTNSETFYAFNVVSGNGILKTQNAQYKLKLGDSFILPASLGKYKIEGKIDLLKAYIK